MQVCLRSRAFYEEGAFAFCVGRDGVPKVGNLLESVWDFERPLRVTFPSTTRTASAGSSNVTVRSAIQPSAATGGTSGDPMDTSDLPLLAQFLSDSRPSTAPSM